MITAVHSGAMELTFILLLSVSMADDTPPIPAPQLCSDPPRRCCCLLFSSAAPSPSRCVLRVALVRRAVGSGFLGRHLIPTLLCVGDAVRCCDIVTGVHDHKGTGYQGDITGPTDAALLI